jgi:hypothetical protein
MNIRRILAPLVLAAVLAGCANVVKIGPGDTVVADRVAVNIDGAWNQLNLPGTATAATWTQDGITLDLLQFYVAVKDGVVLAPTAAKEQRPLVFKAGMQPHEIVALFQGLYTRDGSTFALDRLEPADFLGGSGFRFQYTVVRKEDDVKLSGVAWGAVRGNELFAMTFTAPRAGFFPRHEKRVEQIAKTARLKG